MTSDNTDEPEYNIHWIEDVLEEVLQRNPDIYVLSSGKSTSGAIHIGFVRELIVTDVIKRALEEKGKQVRTFFIADDYDPVRSFPPSTSLKLDEWLGVPYSDVPDEFGCCESFGAHNANELIETFPYFGLNPEIVWHHELYETAEMLNAVRICLQNTEIIREIMIQFVAKDLDEQKKADYIESMKSWYPATILCPKCKRFQAGAKGSIIVNRVTLYNPETDEVSFNCPNCGHSDTLSLDKVRLKLSWRVDWVAKWYVLNVTCEPAGKDHAVKGGSYDTGLEICKRVFGWPGPVPVPFEWVRIGGRDMSTSEGIVFTPKVWLTIAPPELYRYMMLKTGLERAIDIHPERLPDLIDEYDRFERLYYDIEQGGDENREIVNLLYPLTLAGPPSKYYVPKLPYKFAVLTSQLDKLLGNDVVMERCVQVLKKLYRLETISDEAKNLISTRLSRARTWAEEYGSQRDRIEVSETVPDEIKSTLTDDDKRFLTEIYKILETEYLDDEEIQTKVFEVARDIGIKDKRAFIVLYRIILSRKSGPRLGPFINLLGRDWILERITSVL
jgi:lysyl-tRNA synthetase class 1